MKIKEYFIPFFFGFIGIFSFAPFSLKPLIIISYAYLIKELAFKASSLKQLIMWSIGHWGFGMSWLIVSVYYYGNTSIVVSLVIFILLIFFLTVFFSLPLLIIRTNFFQESRYDNYKFIPLVISLFVLNEWSMYYLLYGVPWLIPGVVFLDTITQNIFPFFGVLSASIFIYTFSTLIAISWHNNKKNLLVISMFTLLFFIPNFYERISDGSQIKVSIVQPSSDPFLKYKSNYKNKLEDNLLSLIHEVDTDSDLIVLPEAELPYAYESNNFSDFKKRISLDKTIIGGIWHVSEGNLFNSMVNFELGGVYNKVHLVPFGEFIPLISSLRGLISFFDMPMSDVTRGQYNQESMLIGLNPKIQAAPLICFDIAFGNTVRKSNISSLFMINISNDTWFGNSIGPHQHLEIARVRSIENNRWMIRATNDGFSAIIDNNGTIVDKLEKGISGVLNSSIRLEKRRTIYSKYGYVLPYLVALLIILISAIINICSRKPS